MLHEHAHEAACCCSTVDQSLISIAKVSPVTAVTALVVDLHRVLATKFDGEARKAVSEVLDELSVAGSRSMSEADAKKLIRKLETRLGTKFSASVAKEIKAAVAAMYLNARRGAATKLGIKGAFNLTDKRTQKWLRKNYVFWVGKYHSTQLSAQIAAIVRKRIIDKGLTRFHAAEVMEGQLKRIYGLGKGTGRPAGLDVPLTFHGSPRQYFGGLSNHAATTARMFADLESMVEAEVDVYRISTVGDIRVCPRCQFMDGKTFTVSQGISTRDKVLGSSDPDAVRKATPWRSPEDIKRIAGVSPTAPANTRVTAKGRASLSDAGINLPPFHYLCRCSIDLA